MARPTARARLTGAAFELFTEQGFDATTIDEIAERAGVGRTTFFRTFKSKEDVVFPEHDTLLSAIEARLAASTADNALLAIADAARLVLLHYLDEGDLARARYRLTSSVPALRYREIASAQQYRLLFKRYIRGWFAGEDNAELRADLMAGSVVTAHNHVLRRWLRGQVEDPLPAFDDAMREVGGLYRRRRDVSAEETTVVVIRSAEDVETVLPRIRAALQE